MDASLVAHAGTLRAIGSSCPVYTKYPSKEERMLTDKTAGMPQCLADLTSMPMPKLGLTKQRCHKWLAEKVALSVDPNEAYKIQISISSFFISLQDKVQTATVVECKITLEGSHYTWLHVVGIYNST